MKSLPTMKRIRLIKLASLPGLHLKSVINNSPIGECIEWFSFECRKTKTKVITLANHKEHRQYSEPIKIRSNDM